MKRAIELEDYRARRLERRKGHISGRPAAGAGRNQLRFNAIISNVEATRRSGGGRLLRDGPKRGQEPVR